MSKKSFLVICGLALGMSVNAQYLRTSYFIPQFGITECFIQYKCSVKTPPPHTIRSG